MTTSTQHVIQTPHAPKAVGPYSQGITANGFVFVAGQTGINPQKGQLTEGVEAQTRQAMENIKAILSEAGSGLDRVVKTTVYLKSIDDFALVNSIYASYFPTSPPARTTIGVANLPIGALVEIEVIALAG
jgi:2-iminobutanoate/2-iminopropanoate deaminase